MKTRFWEVTYVRDTRREYAGVVEAGTEDGARELARAKVPGETPPHRIGVARIPEVEIFRRGAHPPHREAKRSDLPQLFA